MDLFGGVHRGACIDRVRGRDPVGDEAAAPLGTRPLLRNATPRHVHARGTTPFVGARMNAKSTPRSACSMSSMYSLR